jgi:hypothetical protein
MSSKLGIVAGFALAFVLGFMVATSLQAPDHPAGVAPAADSSGISGSEVHSRPPDPMLTVAYSRKCATESGICMLDEPAPSGSRCSCPDKTRGTIVR